MLYVFHGSDIKSSGEKAHRLIASLRLKKPEAAFERIEASNWSQDLVTANLGGQGLFSNKYIIFLDRVTENSEAKVQISGLVSAMNGSGNIFVVLEARLNAELKKVFEKSAEKIVVSDEKTDSIKGSAGTGTGGVGKKDFNIFALADAIGSRDRVKAWLIYRQAIDNGLEAESILGTIFWQIKSMILASRSKSAGEAGLNPFVFSKSKRYAGNYSEPELAGLFRNLIVLYHEGHRGRVGMELAMEMMLLGRGRGGGFI